ncbi:unnamed protein product [Cladocopium goreaui]|nr:unnamed protein product [Cladocopium goreaui]
MVRSLRNREVKDAAAEASTSPPVTDDVAAVDAVDAGPGPPLEAKPEEPQGEEVLVGHTAMDLVALGQRADKEQCAAEEEKLPCLSRCRAREHRCDGTVRWYDSRCGGMIQWQVRW